MKKRFKINKKMYIIALSIILVALIACCIINNKNEIIPISQTSQKSASDEEEYIYTVISPGTIRLDKYNGYNDVGSTVVIPSTYANCSVVEIGEECFARKY